MSKKIKCRADGCKGIVDTNNLKFINQFKYSAKCKVCGRNHFLGRKLNRVG